MTEMLIRPEPNIGHKSPLFLQSRACDKAAHVQPNTAPNATTEGCNISSTE